MDDAPQHQVPPGRDTPTGTDPDARYTGPGYEDVSFGQAVDRDAALADRLAEETGSDEEAEERFEDEAVGAPTIRRQHDEASRREGRADGDERGSGGRTRR